MHVGRSSQGSTDFGPRPDYTLHIESLKQSSYGRADFVCYHGEFYLFIYVIIMVVTDGVPQ